MDSAIFCYRKVIAVDSTYQKAYYNLGIAYYKMHEVQRMRFPISSGVSGLSSG